MAIKAISSIEFETIVDKYNIREICIDNHFKNIHNNIFPTVDIGITTYCESSDRRIIILRFKNNCDKVIDDKITLCYNPVATIGRSCLFVKPDDVTKKRIESILNDSEKIRFFFYDVNHPESMIGLFKDRELQETIIPYQNPTIDYDVVIVLETGNIRYHLSNIINKYDCPYSPMEPNTVGSRRQKIVDQYISGFSYKHLLLIVILTTVIISFSMVFGVDDIESKLSINATFGGDSVIQHKT